MRFYKIFNIFLFLSLAVLLRTPNCRAESEIKVGVILGLTGPAHAWSKQARYALEIAKNEINLNGGINQKNIKLIFEDSKTDSKSATIAFHKLVTQDKVVAIIGGIWDFTALPLEPLAKQHKILLITPAIFDSQLPKNNKYFATTAPRISSMINSTEHYFELHKDIKSIVTICPEGVWGNTYNSNWSNVANKFGVKVIESISYSQFDSDFRIEALKIKRHKPDAVFICYKSDIIHRRFNELKFFPKIHTTSDIREAISYRGFSINNAENTYFIDWRANKNFNDKFLSLYKEEPIFAPQNSYEALHSLSKALKNNIIYPHHGLKSIKYEGIAGPINFTQSMAGNHSLSQLFTIKNQKISLVK